MQGFRRLRLASVLREELECLDVRALLAHRVSACLPPNAANRARTALYRLAGYDIGAGTTFLGSPTIIGPRRCRDRLSFGAGCVVNVGCVIDLSADVVVGNQVGIGHDTLILTGSHDIWSAEQRLGMLYSRPVQVGDGAWLGARCTVLPGVTIGAGAVVAAGSVVTRDVAPNVLVAGIPARHVRDLETAPADT